MKKPSYLLLCSMICLLAFIAMALTYGSPFLTTLDYTVLETLAENRLPWVTTVMHGFAFIGGTRMVVVLSVMLIIFFYWRLRYKRELFLFAFVMLSTAAANTLLKQLFQRSRPEIFFLVEEPSYSFPSGHSMAAMSLYGILIYLLWRHMKARGSKAALLFAGVGMILTMGFSRMYLGVHYFSDVTAGFLCSLSILTFSIWAFWKTAPRKRKDELIGN
ncbi:phosphatase PAP2 family protein [Shouchella shacheensis]|uniref:phosphatase PAP2 family protein n=1 Tax=Shouchella shacheensis TaxID=1649580 RepID=UPI00073FDDCA|nr:phosphatase PAP2 family protein [Shouchella shacheensis]